MKEGAAGQPQILIVVGGDQIYKSSTPGRIKFVGISDVDGLLPEGVRTRRLGLG